MLLMPIGYQGAPHMADTPFSRQCLGAAYGLHIQASMAWSQSPQSGAPAWPNTSSSGQVFWRCWKISSGSTAACVASCAASARPRAHSGTGLRGAAPSASSSSLSLSLLRQQGLAFRVWVRASASPRAHSGTDLRGGASSASSSSLSLSLLRQQGLDTQGLGRGQRVRVPTLAP